MLSPERWLKVKEILSRALELSPSERRAFIKGECGDDNELREEIESLLDVNEESESFIESPVLVVSSLVTEETPVSFIGKEIGAYKIESQIGRGGMGAVFLATRADKQFQKQVAIKLIKRGLDTDDIIRRFRYERQILAGLDHPNITRLLDGGATDDGLPFLVMDYVEGLPLNQFCDERQLTIKERLKLFLQICSAVSYAHQNLIIHRDIKPSNILVTKDGVPKLLDFGIAKLLVSDNSSTIDRTLTATQAMTPEYASPEQVLGNPVTTATDVYSLGVLLYELLTGHRPFRIKTNNPNEVSHIITDTEPPRPSSVVTQGRKIGNRQPAIGSQLKGDLDNIVLMAMRKEAERRYSSVEQFASDIRRYLEGLPVIARQDTFTYRAGKFIRRNKGFVAAGTGIAISLIAGILSTKRQANIARNQRDKAERVNKFLQRMLNSADPRAQGKDVKVIEVLSLAAQSIETEFAEQPEISADLHATIGKTYLSLGHLDDAETHLHSALETRLKIFGRNRHESAMSLNNFGKLLCVRGNIAEAEPLFREALTTMRRLQGNEDLDVASIINNLGYLLLLKGEYEESARCHHEELEIRRSLLGEIHPDVARSLAHLANVLVNMGKKEAAEPLHRQSLKIMREFYGSEHPDIAQTIINLVGAIYHKNIDEAESLCREALIMRRKLLGDDHPDVAWSLYNMAFVLNHKGEYVKASEYAEEALKMRGVTLPDEHPVISSTLLTLARSMMELNQPEKAEPLLRECLKLRRRSLPSDHWLIAASNSILGECLIQLGQYEKAKPLLLESYEILKTKLGAEHEHTHNALKRIEKFNKAYYSANATTSC